ncbi:Brefeldin A-inhibited guanine nucleotide-exchange protein 3 [Nymphon striatum]|nr:Brefeldin A-inhibited guanine nucleotide-exchange protein 3 [Nymphon striatum]
MELVLEQILKDSSSAKHPLLRIACKETIDFLENQQGFLHASPSELREKCGEVFRLALETKNNKLVSHALSGFQKMLRDNSFNSMAFEKPSIEAEEKLLPYQVLQSLSCVPELPDDIQVEFLKLLISISCTNNWSLTNKTVLWIVQLCAEFYISGSGQVKTAAQATASQTLSSYSLFLQEELRLQNEDNGDSNAPENELFCFVFQPIDILTDEDVVGLFEKLLPIFIDLCNRLSKKHKKSKNIRRPTIIILESILALLSSISMVDLSKVPDFTKFLWQELCPALIAVLGSPLTDKNIVSSQPQKQLNDISSGEEIGRGSACLTTAPSFRSFPAKIIYSISVQLVRLIGPIQSLRSVLESLFHRILLYPPPQHRLEALKVFREMLKKPERLLDFSQPMHLEENKNSRCDDLSLLRLFMDAAKQCCHCDDMSVCYLSIECVVMILSSLEDLCHGNGLKSQQVNLINRLYPELEDADYKSLPRNEFDSALGDLDNNSMKDIDAQDDISIKGYDAQDEVSSDGSDRQSIHKRYRKTLADIKKFSSSEDDDEDFGEIQDVEAEVYGNLDNLANEIVTEKIVICNENAEESDKKSLEGCNSDSSGATEGPEEGLDNDIDAKTEVYCAFQIDYDLEEEERIKAERESARLDKVPKTLLGDDAGKVERERVERLCQVRNEMAEKERSNAYHFVHTLQELLPKILAIKSSISVDMALQEFASSYCDGVWDKQNKQPLSEGSNRTLMNIVIMNADGVYLATYSALLLSLKLMRNCYYSDNSKSVPLTEEQFIEEVHGSGVLVYLSAVWLAQVYQLILNENILQNAGYNPISMDNCALINILTGLGFGIKNNLIIVSDIDGLGSSHQGDQLLSDYQRLEKATTNVCKSPQVEAGQKIARRILLACWDNILDMLSLLLNNKNSFGGVTMSISLMLGAECAKEDHKKAQDAIATCLDGLQKAARLSNMLGLQNQCGAVFSQLARASCLTDNCNNQPPISGMSKYLKKPNMLSMNKNKALRLHSSYVLSMDVILGRGLELSSHSPDGWKHVFRCCVYVAELEHKFYSKNQTVFPKVQATSKKQSSLQTDDLTFSVGVQDYEETTCDDINNFPVMPTTLMTPCLKVPDLVKDADLIGGSGMLNPDQVAKVLFCLSQHIDRLYENAATKLNLSALIAFLTELCAVSQSQLFTQKGNKVSVHPTFFRSPSDASTYKENTLLLYRLGEVMLKCVRSGRPMIHIMKAWSVVAPHFVEAACHKDRTISKKAVTCIHDIVNALLSSQTELPHFHFNEALFRPFENLLTLELCDADIQDQIVSSICEFVEGCTTDIKSGWRPLFGALRAVQIPVTQSSSTNVNVESKDSAEHMRAVLDVFEAFLNTDNVLVFANAAVDCILCLLKHVRGPTEIQDNNEESVSTESHCLDLCVAALNYLYQCSNILASMYKMPACPVFHAANRITLNTSPHFVDPVIPNFEIIHFSNEKDQSEFLYHMEFLEMKETSNTANLDSLDNHTSILHVWFLLLEGLAGAVATCPRKYQPHTIETLFSLLREIFAVPGPEFAIYCVNHLLLPMLQGWIRRTNRIYRGWDNFAPNFKQCCGLATDLVVEYITKLSENNFNVNGIQLMLQQLFIIMNECISQPTEVISRLGCACIRHAVFSLGSVMSPELWTVTCSSLNQAMRISLHNIIQLMMCFHTDSDNFYGDIGMVKVAVRRDCLRSESERLKQLAHQVFLLDNQRITSEVIENSHLVDNEDCSYIFLLHPPNVVNTINPELYIIRVPFKNIVVGLLSHQLILQTVGTMLLQGTKHVIPSLASILLSSSRNENVGDLESRKLPGMMPYLKESHLKTLLQSLSMSYIVAYDFDSRPGLKFLIQKVCDAQVAVNLYKQAGAAWTIHTVALFELSLANNSQPLTQNCVKSLLTDKDSKEKKCVNFNKNGSSDVKLSQTFQPIVSLQEHLIQFCDEYIDLVLDKDGRLYNADSIADQPIFFLTAPQDDFPITSKGSFSDSSKDIEPKEVQNSVDGESDHTAHEGTEPRSQSPIKDSTHIDEDKVYTVATEKTIQNLMLEYKKRKQQRAMPSREPIRNRAAKGAHTNSDSKPCEQIPEEIDNQRRSSIMKDGEARLEVFTEMIISVLELLQQLSDDDFKTFLPLVFPFVSSLLLYCSEPKLRLSLIDWLTRVSMLYQFSVPE